MAGRTSPEYSTIRVKLPEILNAISGSPSTIPQLTTRLVAQDVIPDGVKTEVDNLPIGPYERANKLIAAVHTTVEFQPNVFYTLVDILRQCSLGPIATVIEEECRKHMHFACQSCGYQLVSTFRNERRKSVIS